MSHVPYESVQTCFISPFCMNTGVPFCHTTKLGKWSKESEQERLLVDIFFLMSFDFFCERNV